MTLQLKLRVALTYLTKFGSDWIAAYKVLYDYITVCVVASRGFWQMLAAAKPDSRASSSNLETRSPRTVWKRHSLMPFPEAYIKVRGFRVE